MITNITLASRTGTETYVRDLSIGLQRRGHHPVVFSPDLGPIAEEMRARTVPVVDNLDGLSVAPDIIHGHHHPQTMAALLRFAQAPAVFFCHDWSAWHDAPPRFPRILRYVAVDHTCRHRLVFEESIPEERVRVVFNFVDLERFRPRGPLPERPQRALVFSNAATARTHLNAVRRACTQLDLSLHVIGAGAGNSASRPEALLPGYDIVFAKGRAALEALAVGAAVVLCDAGGAGPMVTTGEMEELRKYNFGIRTLRNPLDPASLSREIARYDAGDAGEVSSWIRRTAGVEGALDELIGLYREVIDENRSVPAPGAAAELQAASRYLQRWLPRVGSPQVSSTEIERLRREIDDVHNSATLRLRDRVIGIPLIGPLARALARWIPPAKQ